MYGEKKHNKTKQERAMEAGREGEISNKEKREREIEIIWKIEVSHRITKRIKEDKEDKS